MDRGADLVGVAHAQQFGKSGLLCVFAPRHNEISVNFIRAAEVVNPGGIRSVPATAILEPRIGSGRNDAFGNTLRPDIPERPDDLIYSC